MPNNEKCISKNQLYLLILLVTLKKSALYLKPKLCDLREMRSAKRLRIPQASGTKNVGMPSGSCE